MWQQFLIKQETTAANLVILAVLAVWAWFHVVKGKKYEHAINWFCVLTFWVACAVMGVVNW